MDVRPARFLLAVFVSGISAQIFGTEALGTPAPCDAECVEDRRLSTGVKGFPAAGQPVLLERANGASPQQLAAQYQALLEIEGVRVQYDGRGVPGYVFGKTSLKLPQDFQLPRDQAALDAVISKIRSIFLAEGTETLQVERISTMPYGLVVVLRQSIRGIPVRDGQVVLNTDGKTERVNMISGPFLPDRGLPRLPRITAGEAATRAFDWLREYKHALENPPMQADMPEGNEKPAVDASFSTEDVRIAETPILNYVIGAVDANPPQAKLVWAVELLHAGVLFKSISIDALDGSVVGVSDHTRNLTRRVFDSNNTAANPGTPVFSEGGWSSDIVATTAYTNVGLALGALTPVATPAMDTIPYRISVRWIKEPGKQVYAESGMTTSGEWTHDLRFGPGLPSNPSRPSSHLGNALDAVAHEVGHRANWWNTNLEDCLIDCEQRGGALDEGFADFAAIVADMVHQKPVPWNIGDVFLNDSLGFRSASAPKSSDSLSSDYWPLRSLRSVTEGGAHDNSTILTHAYYLLVNGGVHNRAGQSGIPTIDVNGIGRSRAEEIFFRTLSGGSLGGTSTFFSLRDQTIERATTLYGQTEASSVTAAWNAVGVTPCTNTPPPPQVSLTDWCPWWQIAVSTVPGATIYGIQGAYSPSFATPWTQAQGENPSCLTQLYQRTYFRARACNGCGCSAWGPTDWAQPYGAPCP